MKKALLFGNIALFVLICAFVASPLRLNTDSIRLFAMALPAAIGGAYGTDQFPPFYPHLLCFLMKVGCCNSFALLSINMVALLVALIVLYKIARLNGCTFVESMFILLSLQMCWCVAKHALLPQTDILLLPFFLGGLLAAIYAERAESMRKRVLWLLAATIVAVVAMTVRIAAIPLFAVVAIVATGVTPQTMFSALRKKSFWITAVSLAGLIVAGVMLAIRYTEFDAEGGYFRMFKRFILDDGLSNFAKAEWKHLGEIMQLSLNVSVARIPAPAAALGSIVMSALFVFVVAKEAKWLDWVLLLGLLGYGAEIFLWPCTDARFLLPAYPIAAIVVVHFMSRVYREKRALRLVAVCYMVGFVLMGLVSWGWLARQWCYGKNFYRHTAEPLLSRDFKNAHQRPIKNIPDSELTLPLFILKKFDPAHTLNEPIKLDLRDYIVFTAPYSRQ